VNRAVRPADSENRSEGTTGPASRVSCGKSGVSPVGRARAGAIEVRAISAMCSDQPAEAGAASARPLWCSSAPDRGARSYLSANTMFTGRWCGGTSDIGCPAMWISPLVGLSKPASMRKGVVLPQPDEPSREKNALRRMSRDIVSMARKAPKYLSIIWID